MRIHCSVMRKIWTIKLKAPLTCFFSPSALQGWWNTGCQVWCIYLTTVWGVFLLINNEIQIIFPSYLLFLSCAPSRDLTEKQKWSGLLNRDCLVLSLFLTKGKSTNAETLVKRGLSQLGKPEKNSSELDPNRRKLVLSSQLQMFCGWFLVFWFVYFCELQIW